MKMVHWWQRAVNPNLFKKINERIEYPFYIHAFGYAINIWNGFSNTPMAPITNFVLFVIIFQTFSLWRITCKLLCLWYGTVNRNQSIVFLNDLHFCSNEGSFHTWTKIRRNLYYHRLWYKGFSCYFIHHMIIFWYWPEHNGLDESHNGITMSKVHKSVCSS